MKTNDLSTTRLTNSEIAKGIYQKEGYYLSKAALPQDLLLACQSLLELWVDDMAENWLAQNLITDLRKDLDFRNRFNFLWLAAGKPPYPRSPRAELVALDPMGVFNVMRHPALLALAETFLGTSEITAHGAWNSRPKSPDATFTDTPWHQDGQYFREQAHLHTMTVWFPLHEVSESDSCLAVTSNFDPSHLYENFNDPENGFIGLKREDAKKLITLPIAMDAGDALVFPQSTPHRAMPNRSGKMRWSMDLRYVATPTAHRGAFEHGAVVKSENKNNLTSYTSWLRKWKK
jgi:hypothetical protein